MHGLQIGRAASHCAAVSVAGLVNANIEEAIPLSSFFGNVYTVV
jgi:hypothetical protein